MRLNNFSLPVAACKWGALGRLSRPWYSDTQIRIMICSAWHVRPICEIASDGGFVATAGEIPCPLAAAWIADSKLFASVGGGRWEVGRDEFRGYAPLSAGT